MVKKQIKIDYLRCAVALVAVVFLSASSSLGAGDKATHPDLSEQEMLVACADCHREATPEVTKEWYDSLHGIAMVKCYQCHGTFESFAVTPTRENCGTCHTDMLAKCPDNKPCWECHIPHSFKQQK